MSEGESTAKLEVRVGRWTADGAFTGEVVRFSGEELGSYTEYTGERMRDAAGMTYTLYLCPGDTYRVYVEEWSRWEGSEDSASLHPFVEKETPFDDEPTRYTTCSEAEARRLWPELFAAVGMPNVRDID